MKVVLHDRTDGLGQEVRDQAERKLSRLTRHFGKVAEADLDFSEERKRSGLTTSVCRINVRIDGRRSPVLSAHERGPDPQSALDLALDKIDRQVVRHKERITNRKQPQSPVRMPQPSEVASAPRSEEPERVRLKLRPMTMGRAVKQLEAGVQPFLVYVDEDMGGIMIAARRADGSVAVFEPVVT
ncbi:MAG TPA: ribosome-associated translation inhibitor RaiA [Patescibacteria group bacterium]|nr:ribosome-associated translation inhibitor RaiA [Patescibacteria group bacterium]